MTPDLLRRVSKQRRHGYQVGHPLRFTSSSTWFCFRCSARVVYGYNNIPQHNARTYISYKSRRQQEQSLAATLQCYLHYRHASHRLGSRGGARLHDDQTSFVSRRHSQHQPHRGYWTSKRTLVPCPACWLHTNSPSSLQSPTPLNIL